MRVILVMVSAAMMGLGTGCPDLEVPIGECTPETAARDCPGPTVGAECREPACGDDKWCTTAVKAGFCFDLETQSCLAEGATSPDDGCRVCDPAVTTSSLVNKSCGAGERCQAGDCVPEDTDVVADADDTSEGDIAADLPPDGPEDVATDLGADLDVTPDTAADTAEDTAADTAEDVSNPDVGDATQDLGMDADVTDTAMDADIETSAPSGYVVYPAGFTAVGPHTPSNGMMRLRDQRFVIDIKCSGGFCLTGGIVP